MAAFQKFNHLRVLRLAIGDSYIEPVEAPAPLDEDASCEEVIEAFNGLLATLTAAGIILPQDEPAEAPQDAPEAD